MTKNCEKLPSMQKGKAVLRVSFFLKISFGFDVQFE